MNTQPNTTTHSPDTTEGEATEPLSVRPPSVQINYCGLSGGKDSTATALWLIHESGVPKESIRFTMCDTGNEHRFTYEHIDMLSRRFQEWGCGPVILLKPERDFYELAKHKTRFPSMKARFCTQFLKVIPTREDVTALRRLGFDVIVNSGVRASESEERSALPERGFDDMFGCIVNRPLLHWSFENVVDLHNRHDVPLNPLYAYGAKRVGCFPCVNARKSEIKLISIHFPERIDMIREKENSGIGLNGRFQSFFQANIMPDRFKSREYTNRKGKNLKVGTIDDVVEWSHTMHGGIEEPLPLFDDDASLVCPSGSGMCE